MKFSELNLDESVLQAIDAMNFQECTPVQEHTIPVILEGRDLIGVAQTGTGKTEVMKQVSKLIGIPYVIEDATKFTMDGYVGRSVSDMLIDLYKAADYDLDLAQTGLLIIDEIDKKF